MRAIAVMRPVGFLGMSSIVQRKSASAQTRSPRAGADQTRSLSQRVPDSQGYDAAELLVRYGADANSMAGERHDFRTVLHYAVLSSNKDIVKLVLSKGAKVNMSAGYEHPSPLDFAVLRCVPVCG
jgi:hypothetical protein